MSFLTGTAVDVPDLITKLDAFLTLGHTLDPVYAGVGTGTLDGAIGTAATVLETITISFSSATDFSVAGSVSGALGNGTVGTAFACVVCAFTVSAGGTAWANGDTITVLITPPWEQKQFSTTPNDVAAYSCWKAPGNDGASAIYTAIQRIANETGDYDDLRLNGYTAYNAGLDFYGQAGGMTEKGPCLPLLRVGDMPFWFSANGRRVVIVAKVSTVYITGYLGLITPYLNPSADPYPLLIGGCMAYDIEPAATSVNWRWSVTADSLSAFPKSRGVTGSTDRDDHQCRFRRPDGVFAAFSNYSRLVDGGGGLLTPGMSIGTDLRPGLDGSYPVLPIVLSERYPANVWGELDGVGWVSGHANTAENTVTQNRITWLVVQNIYRTTKTSYFAVKLA